MGALRTSRVAGTTAAGALLSTLSLAAAEPVVVVASEPDAPLPQQRLLEALDSQLGELGVRVVLSNERAPRATERPGERTDTDVLAFVWIEGTPETLVVHFYEPAGASLRERRIPATATDAASLEEVAIIVRSAAAALLERDRAVPERALVPAPAPVIEPTPPRTLPASVPGARRPSVELSVGYVGGLYAVELPWQQGVRGRAAWCAGSSLRFGAGAAWFAPSHRDTDALTLTLRRTSYEAFVGYELALGASHLALGPEATVGLDVLARRTDRALGELEATPASTRLTGYLSTRLRLAGELSPRVGVFLTAGAEFVLNRVEHVAGEVLVVEPLRARPALGTGLLVRLP